MSVSMPRPSKGERSNITLRLAPDLLAKADAAAKAAGVDRQAWIEAAIGERLTTSKTLAPTYAEMPVIASPVLPKDTALIVPAKFAPSAKSKRFAGVDALSGEPIYR